MTPGPEAFSRFVFREPHACFNTQPCITPRLCSCQALPRDRLAKPSLHSTACAAELDAAPTKLDAEPRLYLAVRMDTAPGSRSSGSSSESDPTYKWQTPAAHAARAARGPQRRPVRRPVRQHSYVRPVRCERGIRLRTPSDDEDEVLGPARRAHAQQKKLCQTSNSRAQV
jgi:hypothetical protein